MAEIPERQFAYTPMQFVTFHGELIYIGVKDRKDFDAIPLPVKEYGPNESGHVLTKTVEQGEAYIVFQHWLLSETLDSMVARRRAEKALSDLAGVAA